MKNWRDGVSSFTKLLNLRSDFNGKTCQNRPTYFSNFFWGGGHPRPPQLGILENVKNFKNPNVFKAFFDFHLEHVKNLNVLEGCLRRGVKNLTKPTVIKLKEYSLVLFFIGPASGEIP